jgi:Sap-like sulfolipid-1-addressing protein
MSAEALVLALTTVFRPTSATAVAAMLSTRHPQRLLVAYLLAGLTFSLAVGMLVVVLLGGSRSTHASTSVRPVLDLVIGICALGCAASAWIGWLPRFRDAAAEQDSWMQRRLKDLSLSGAAIAGVLTHLPGPVYLAALNAIVDMATGTANVLLQVVVYNLIWFSLAIVAFVLSVHRPTVFREILEQIAARTRQHLRTIIVGFCGALGGYLVVRGVLGLDRVAS